jgi:hypothetical protein
VVNKALLMSSTGQPRQAEAIMRELVARDNPPLPNMQFVLASILAAQPEGAKKAEALALCREIEQLHPGEFPVDSLVAFVNAQP